MGIKITDIIIHIIKSELDVPFAFSQGWVNKRSATLVQIKTSDGLTGWGEAFCQGLEPPEISAAVISSALKPILLNQSPLDIEVLWHKMYNATRDFGRKGSVVSGISAIDIALWDIAGQFYNQPIYQLLGGAFRKEIKPYATGFYRIKGQGEAKRLADEAITHFENGFDHMKVKLGFGLKDDLETNALKSLAAGCNLVLYFSGKSSEMIKLLNFMPYIDEFTTKKTSAFYKFLR